MTAPPRQVWAHRLESHARLTLGTDPEQGIRHILSGPVGKLPVARLVGSVLLGSMIDQPGPPQTLDEQLWTDLVRGSATTPPDTTGPLTGEPIDTGIEVWTEIELASIHAAWSLGPGWRAAAERAARWMVESIQPDNATNHPWAVHAFAELADDGAGHEFDLYAQTLLHNCMVGSGSPDGFSAMILLHASRSLQAG